MIASELNHRLLIIIFILISAFAAFGQTASDPFCGTVDDKGPQYLPPDLRESDATCYPDVSGPYYIRIYMHVIRRGDGTGGYTNQEVENAVNILREDFKDHNIFFVWDACGIDNIPNDEIYYNGVFSFMAGPDPFLTSITSINSHGNGIDIYLLPPQHPARAGKASGIPGKAIVIGGSWVNPQVPLIPSHVLSHEMGHCLGLYHTFNNSGGTDCGIEPDCCRKGDYVCDTKPYPLAIFQTDPQTCTFAPLLLIKQTHATNLMTPMKH